MFTVCDVSTVPYLCNVFRKCMEILLSWTKVNIYDVVICSYCSSKKCRISLGSPGWLGSTFNTAQKLAMYSAVIVVGILERSNSRSSCTAHTTHRLPVAVMHSFIICCFFLAHFNLALKSSVEVSYWSLISKIANLISLLTYLSPQHASASAHLKH